LLKAYTFCTLRLGLCTATSSPGEAMCTCLGACPACLPEWWLYAGVHPTCRQLPAHCTTPLACPCSNVLLTESLRACICDLGACRVLGSQPRSVAGFTCTHAAPEQLMGLRCTLAADMYSFGVLLVEVVTGRPVERRGDTQQPVLQQHCSQVGPTSCRREMKGDIVSTRAEAARGGLPGAARGCQGGPTHGALLHTTYFSSL